MRTQCWITTTLSLIIHGMLGFEGVNSMINSKTWTYEIKSIETGSNHPELVNIDFHLERISRGVYSISGTVMLDLDIVDGDDFQITANSYRSDNGVSDYKKLPFAIPTEHFYKFMDTHYKDMLMETLGSCSDLPSFEDKFERPLEKKTYTLDKCQFSQDGFPNHLQEGFYKITVAGVGAVEWSLEIIVEVEKA